MGTTMSFFYMKNEGRTPEELRQILTEGRKDCFRFFLGYRADAAWLPCFETGLCEGNILGSRDCEKLSAAFGAPVLSAALFDSDVLYLSCADKARGVKWDYAKANFEDEEGYTEGYAQTFPSELLTLFPQSSAEDMRAIWDREEEVFADDRMCDLLGSLGLPVVYGADDFPEGYTVLTGQ